MKIEIKSDVFDIVKRVKEIDKGYYILFDISKQVFELHYKYQPNSYCFQYEFKNLDKRFLDKVYSTNIRNIDNIIADIDKNNKIKELNQLGNVKDYASCISRDIYEYNANSSKEYKCDSAYLAVWR